MHLTGTPELIRELAAEHQAFLPTPPTTNDNKKTHHASTSPADKQPQPAVSEPAPPSARVRRSRMHA